MYGYIYKTTNLIDNLIYVGQKHSAKFLGNSYLGSGKLLRKAVKKYGKENFTVELIETCDSPEALDEREIYWIAYYNATDKTVGYNICEGGHVNRTMVGENNPFYGKHHTEQTITSIIEQSKNWFAEEDNRSKHSQATKLGYQKWFDNLSDEELAEKKEKWHLQNNGENNPMFGKCHSNATKAILSKKRKQFYKELPDNWVDPAQTAEARAKRKASLKGHKVSKETREKIRQTLLAKKQQSMKVK